MYYISHRVVFAGLVYVVLLLLIGIAYVAQHSGDYVTRSIRTRLAEQGTSLLDKVEADIRKQSWRNANQVLAQLSTLEYVFGNDIMSNVTHLDFQSRLARLRAEYREGHLGSRDV